MSTAMPGEHKAAFAGQRPVFFDGRFRPTPTYRRSELLAGNRIVGPALIEEHASTTVLAPGDRLEVDGYGVLVITLGGRPARAGRKRS